MILGSVWAEISVTEMTGLLLNRIITSHTLPEQIGLVVVVVVALHRFYAGNYYSCNYQAPPG